MIDNKTNIEYLVSVIVPCYNAENTILQALKSLEDQSFKNFEVILINDGSTDNSDTIIQKFMINSQLHINYIEKENEGVSKARNTGLDNSTGKYIVFLDADDIYRNDFIERLYTAITEYDVDTAFCCYSRNIENIQNHHVNINEIKKNYYLDHKYLMNRFMHRKGPCAFVTFIYKKSIIDNNNIQFVIFTKYGEDLEFTWKYLSHCTNAVFLDVELYGYYDNPNSAVNNVSWQMVDALYSVKRVEEYLRINHDTFYIKYKKFMFDRTIWALIKDFVQAENKECFTKLTNEFNVKASMKNMIFNSGNFFIMLTAIMFYIRPILFYNIVRKLSFIKRR